MAFVRFQIEASKLAANSEASAPIDAQAVAFPSITSLTWPSIV